MAGEHNGAADFKAHEQGYERFIAIFKAGTVAVAIVAAIVVFLIAH